MSIVITPQEQALRKKAADWWYDNPKATRSDVERKFGLSRPTINAAIRADPRYLNDTRSHGYKTRQAKKVMQKEALRLAKLEHAENVEMGLTPTSKPKPVKSDPLMHPVSPQYRKLEDKLKAMMDMDKDLDENIDVELSNAFLEFEKKYDQKVKLLAMLKACM